MWNGIAQCKSRGNMIALLLGGAKIQSNTFSFEES
jgi:hypothetical protein